MSRQMKARSLFQLFVLMLLAAGCRESFTSLPSFAPPATDATIDSIFGVYFWGSTPTVSTPGSKFWTGINAITKEGFRTARIAVNTDSIANYGLDAPVCAGTSYLKCALEQTPIGATLKASPLTTIIITAYDGVSYTGSNFVKDSFMVNPVNQAAITTEMKDFAYALFKDFNGSGKTLISRRGKAIIKSIAASPTTTQTYRVLKQVVTRLL